MLFCKEVVGNLNTWHAKVCGNVVFFAWTPELDKIVMINTVARRSCFLDRCIMEEQHRFFIGLRNIWSWFCLDWDGSF